MELLNVSPSKLIIFNRNVTVKNKDLVIHIGTLKWYGIGKFKIVT